MQENKQAFVPTSQANVCKPRVPTASTLLANNPGSNANQVVCVYCEKDHVSSSCNTITDVAARKELLCKSGRCFVCLKRHHLSRDCRSNFNCKKVVDVTMFQFVCELLASVVVNPLQLREAVRNHKVVTILLFP